MVFCHLSLFCVIYNVPFHLVCENSPHLCVGHSHETCTKNLSFLNLKKSFSVTFLVFLYSANERLCAANACIQFEQFSLSKVHNLLKIAQYSLTVPGFDAIVCFVRKT